MGERWEDGKAMLLRALGPDTWAAVANNPRAKEFLEERAQHAARLGWSYATATDPAVRDQLLDEMDAVRLSIDTEAAAALVDVATATRRKILGLVRGVFSLALEYGPEIARWARGR